MTKNELGKSMYRWRRLLAKAQTNNDVISWKIYLLSYARDLGEYAECLPSKDGD